MNRDPQNSHHVHAFICTRTKEGKSSCGPKGGAELRERLKNWVRSAGLKDQVQVSASLCLNHCERGITAVIHPAGQWYFNVDKDSDFESLQKEILALIESAKA